MGGHLEQVRGLAQGAQEGVTHTCEELAQQFPVEILPIIKTLPQMEKQSKENNGRLEEVEIAIHDIRKEIEIMAKGVVEGRRKDKKKREQLELGLVDLKEEIDKIKIGLKEVKEGKGEKAKELGDNLNLVEGRVKGVEAQVGELANIAKQWDDFFLGELHGMRVQFDAMREKISQVSQMSSVSMGSALPPREGEGVRVPPLPLPRGSSVGVGEGWLEKLCKDVNSDTSSNSETSVSGGEEDREVQDKRKKV